jgi:hypothetical protein
MKEKFAGLLLLVLSVAVGVSAQTSNSQKGSIQGHVTLKGRSPSDVQVVVWKQPYYSPYGPDIFSTRVDKEGNFKIDVPPGSYYVSANAAGYYAVIDGTPTTRPAAAVVKSGETLPNLEFKLLKGGVITGRVTNESNKPIAEMTVMLNFDDKDGAQTQFQTGSVGWTTMWTDDRGVYRFFGVPPGEYQVTAGDGNPRNVVYEKTAYREKPDDKEPKWIELRETEEISGIDIKLKSAGPMFSISGTIVDAESATPIANLSVGLYTYANNERIGMRPGSTSTNQRGEFTISLVPAGQYVVFFPGRTPPANNAVLTYFGESTPFELYGRDIAGLKLTATRTATVSGSVQFVGEPSKQALASLPELTISAGTYRIGGTVSYRTTRLAPDGTFSVVGLLPGPLSFGLISNSFSLVRTENAGGTGQIELGKEDISGITLMLAESAGSIKGSVQLLNNQAVPNLRGQANIYNETRMFNYAAIDSAGNFLIENLPTGTYRLVINLELPGMTPASTHAEQTVTVKERESTEVRIQLDPKPQPIDPKGRINPNP